MAASGKGRQAFVRLSRRLEDNEVEFVRTADLTRYRVLSVVNLGGPPHPSARLQLQSRPCGLM